MLQTVDKVQFMDAVCSFFIIDLFFRDSLDYYFPVIETAGGCLRFTYVSPAIHIQLL